MYNEKKTRKEGRVMRSWKEWLMQRKDQQSWQEDLWQR
jgi:hypothetical protein